MGFNYDMPDPDGFFKTLKEVLILRKDNKLYDIIKTAKFTLESYGQYAHYHGGGRWNAYATIATFALPVAMLGEIDEQMKLRLKTYCNEIMPPDAGYDITSIVIQPKIISDDGNSISLEGDLEEITYNILDSNGISFPSDLYDKGKEMAEVYLYLYHIENTLRVFLEDKANGQLEFPSEVRKRIQQRKDVEAINKWKSFKAGTDIFYVDLVDLSAVINKNWEIFKEYFPSYSWIDTKIKEIGQCRNPIAHNGYIGDYEKRLLKTNYEGILRQIAEK